MKKQLKLYQKILLYIALFVFIYVAVFAGLYIWDKNNPVDNSIGNPFEYTGYIETVDGTYIGEIYDNHFQGDGQFKFFTKEIYTGQWSDSNMSGTGKMVFKDVGVYNGTYSNSLREGNGTFTWNNGDKYDGEWKNDIISGEGKYTFNNGNYISGTFENNKVKEGTYHIKTKEYECVASVVSHQLSNKVKLTLSTGEIYDGEIKNGKFDGQG